MSVFGSGSKTLLETGAKALIYAQTTGSTDNTTLLQSIIPELSSCTCLQASWGAAPFM